MTRSLPGTLLALCAALGLAACGEDESRPYFTFAGGGFVFNYRNADLYYGFVLTPQRAVPEGTEIEVDFEIPGAAGHHRQTLPVQAGRLRYTFRTPDLDGVVAHRDYIVVVRIVNGGQELARYTKSFRTAIDPSTLPDRPLVVGPAYMPNPDLKDSP
jgi:hypothetical protein